VYMRRIIFLFSILFALNTALGQTRNIAATMKDSAHYIQVTGIVISDSMYRIPFVKIIDISTKRGVIADYYGYFAIVTHPGDTLQFSCLGYKKKYYVVSDTTRLESFSLVQILKEDTLSSDPVSVYPWPSREEFADYFVNMDIPDDDIQRARKRLTPQEMAFVGALLTGDAMMAYNSGQQMYYQSLYTRGQGPQNNLLNPSAWADFLNGLGTGEYRISP
jgi:hypothetical protein